MLALSLSLSFLNPKKISLNCLNMPRKRNITSEEKLIVDPVRFLHVFGGYPSAQWNESTHRMRWCQNTFWGLLVMHLWYFWSCGMLFTEKDLISPSSLAPLFSHLLPLTGSSNPTRPRRNIKELSLFHYQSWLPHCFRLRVMNPIQWPKARWCCFSAQQQMTAAFYVCNFTTLEGKRAQAFS